MGVASRNSVEDSAIRFHSVRDDDLFLGVSEARGGKTPPGRGNQMTTGMRTQQRKNHNIEVERGIDPERVGG